MSKDFKATDIFNASQFKGMKYNPYGLALNEDFDIFKIWPSLNNWDSLEAYKKRRNEKPQKRKGEPDKDYDIRVSQTPKYKDWSDIHVIFAYICFVYDVKSPLIRQTKVLKVRKEWAQALAYLTDKLTPKRVEEILTNADPAIVAIIIEFLIGYQPIKWTMICSYEQQFEEFQTTLMQKTSNVKDDKDLVAAVNAKSALLEKSDKISERLVVLYQEVFTDEFAEVAKTFTKTSPEQRALKNVQRLRR